MDSCKHPDCGDEIWSRSRKRGFCKRHYWQDYHARNREKRLAEQAEWRAKNPDYWRKKDPESKRAADERYRNKPEVKAKRNAASGRYAAERRARVAGLNWEAFTDEEMLELYGSDCHICLKPIDLSAPRMIGTPGWERGLHREHVVAVVNGGGTTLENCRPSHGICNVRKNKY